MSAIDNSADNRTTGSRIDARHTGAPVARAHVAIAGVWARPDLTSRQTPSFHRVVGVVDGGLLMACVGRMAVSELAAIEREPMLADRCVVCDRDSTETTRVRCSI